MDTNRDMTRLRRASWLLALAVVIAALSVPACAASGSSPSLCGPQLMPPHPDLLARIAAEGYDSVTVVDLARLAEQKWQQGIDRPEPPRTPVIGTRPAVVLLVRYTDVAPGVASTSALYQSLLFSAGSYPAPGSMRDFYQSNSYSLFDISPSAVDSAWRTASQARTYYANNDGTPGTADDYGLGAWPNNAQKLVAEAVALADPFINFASYAVGGQVQGLFVVHAGPGAEVTGSPSDIWSHAWALNAYAMAVDGVIVNTYSMEPEYIVVAGDSTIGVFCHEYGHALGLPDLYDTDATSMGLGVWSVMAGGSWNGTNGNSPAYLDAWSRALLGWVTPTVVSGVVSGASLPAAENNSTAYRLWTNGAAGTEYFLLENRQRIAGDFDNALPGGGLLLYHVDENASQNTDWRPLVMVEQADAQWDLQYSANAGDAGDPYPGTSNNRTANASTVPNTRSYAGGDTYVAITNVSNSALTMTADLAAAVTPSADFTGTPTSGWAPLDVYFTDTSLFLPTSWSWAFGDGGTSTVQSPAHTYTGAGSYTVSVTATNGAGSDTETKSGYITASAPPPAADFTATPRSGYAPLDVQFTDTSLYSPTSWSWTFGDGGTSTAQHPLHQYASAGTYAVSLTATNASGSDTETKAGYITVLPSLPAAAFSGSPVTGVVPLIVTFTDASTGVIGSWLWGFGDGDTSTVQSPVHTYSAAGSFDVSLTVTNVSGSDTETKVGYITALPAAPVAAFTGAPTSGVAPLEVMFTDASTGTIDSWVWDFGDGSASTDQDPSHTYTDAGAYAVSLTVSNVTGSDTETRAGYIDVAEPVAAAFSASVTAGVVPLVVLFDDLSSGGPTTWSWDFGDGGTSAEQSPSHTYGDPGYYTVRLTAARGAAVDVESRPGYIAAGFIDTPADHWAFHPILACATAGVVQGYWDKSYQPGEVVSRGQMAVYVSRALAGGDESVPDPTVPAPSFTDVPADHWAYRYIEYAVAADVVQGYPGGTYHPDEAINRGQMAVYIARGVATPTGDAGVPEVPAGAEPTFPDVTDTNEWAWTYKYVEFIAARGVVQGYWDGLYHPEREVTRDQMAVYVQRAFALPMYAP